MDSLMECGFYAFRWISVIYRRQQVILLESDFSATGDIETLDVVTRHGLHLVKIVRLVTCSMVRRSFTQNR